MSGVRKAWFDSIIGTASFGPASWSNAIQIPTGGVTPENTGAYIEAGAVAVGVGSALVSQDLLDNGDWPKLTKIAGKFVAAMKKAKAA